MKRTTRYVRQMPQIYGSLHKPERRFSWSIIWSLFKILFGMGSVALVVYTLFMSPVFSVKTVEVQGVAFNDPATVKATVPQGGNIWRLPVGQIEQEVLQLPSVESVQVLRGLPNTVRIVVTEKRPALRWVSAGTLSLIDESGTVFSQYPVASVPATGTSVGDVLATALLITDSQNLPVALHREVVSVSFVQFVSVVRDNLATSLPELTIDRFEIGATTYDLTLYAKQGMKVQFNTLADPAVAVRNLTRLIKNYHVQLTQQVDLQIDRWAYVR